MRWLDVRLGPSTTGEHVAYIPVVRPTSHRVPLSLSLSQLRAGVTLPALNTSSWLWFGWHVATGLTHSLQVVYSLLKKLASSELACKAVFVPVVCVWRNKGVRREIRDNIH